MYSDEDLAAAVKAGVLTDEAVTAFRAHVAKLRNAPAVDEEHFRFVTGFNDIFVVIACVLLLASLGWIAAAFVSWLGAAAVAAAAWVLAEFFTRRRRMALPSILLLLAFVGGVLIACSELFGETDGRHIAASAIAALAAWLHWSRFHVPITVAAGVAALVGCIVALLFAVAPETRNWTSAISFAAGITVFGLAMHWDAADPARRTLKSDVAFWLHLLAAPLLVHPVFTSFGVSGGQTYLPQAIAVVTLYVAIALISLSIDRRALMVSALAYVLYTFTALLKQYGVVSLSFAITALGIGSALLLLSAFWQPSRTFVLRHLPVTMRRRLAPLR